MKLYLKPEYFQTIHYYFFSLGVFSLTTALMFTEYSIYTFIFVGFYVAHSAISWYMSWFMHRKMKLVYIIQRSSYIVNHMVLVLVAGLGAVGFGYIFRESYDAVMTSMITLNFFVVFLGIMWYAIGATRIAERFFDWREEGRLSRGRDMLLAFRKKRFLELVSDAAVKGYKWGSDPQIDGLFMDLKMLAGQGRDFSEKAKEIEIKLAEAEIAGLEKKMANLGDSEADKSLAESYMNAIKSKRKAIMEYEKAFYRKFHSENA
ncbi:MAG: hypothetical protein J7K54_04935 [Candidatus Aenigmarchaeota archaeon]|nr:hypothetical protein [Candidatus Aenigmarchaeota archaeon]